MKQASVETWLRRKLRYCYSLHECQICGEKITLGQFYRDGGYPRRAHDNCVVKLMQREREALHPGPVE